jgi:putative DNA primase/helicase
VSVPDGYESSFQPEDGPETVDEALGEPSSLIAPSPSKPLAVARLFLDHLYADPRHATLAYYRGEFFDWAGTHWLERDCDALEAALYQWLERAVYRKGDELVSFDPSKTRINNIVHALGRAAYVDARIDVPSWLTDGPGHATEYVALQNGLLHLPSRRMHEHTPLYFSPLALPYAFDPDAPPPARWFQFLEEQWGEDEEMIETLGEIFGYIIGGGTSQQKLFLAVGPTRSGKGTIARVLQALLGVENVAGPTLNGLATQFGMSELIGKPLATISDARLNIKADTTLAVERLLSISGEDILSVQRKFKPDWIGRLPTRFLILTNELPQLSDASETIAGRFVILAMTRSFYGVEDPGLTSKLVAEAPAIFNWALEGLDRLQERGHFLQPSASEAALRQLRDLASPVSAFVRDRCAVTTGEVLKDDLWKAWREWCETEGGRPGTKAVFVRDLRAAYPVVVPSRRLIGGKRVHVLSGISLALDSIPDIPDGDSSGTRAATDRQGNFAQPISRSGMSGVMPSVSPAEAQDDDVLDELLRSRGAPEEALVTRLHR